MATRSSRHISLTAAADLSTKQNLFVIISGDNGCNVAGAGGDAVGTLFNKPTSGLPADIQIGPRVSIILNATLVAGAEVMSDASGKAIAWTTTNRSLGYLLVGGGAGDTVEMLFDYNGRKA